MGSVTHASLTGTDLHNPKTHAPSHIKSGSDEVTAGILKSGLDGSKSANPTVGDVYVATDTNKTYVCYSANVWTEITGVAGAGKPFIFLNPGGATLPNDGFPILEKVSGTNHVFWVAKFDCDGTNVKQDMYFSTMMPAGYGGGTLRITIYSRIEDSTPENSAIIKVRVIGKAHDEVWDDGTGGEEVSITINPTATLWDLLIDYEDLSTTKPSAGEGLLIRVEHDLNQGTMASGKDLQIIGIKIEEI